MSALGKQAASCGGLLAKGRHESSARGISTLSECTILQGWHLKTWKAVYWPTAGSFPTYSISLPHERQPVGGAAVSTMAKLSIKHESTLIVWWHKSAER